MQTPIDAEDEATWPADLIRCFDTKLEALRAFEEERQRVDDMTERDIFVRYNPPRNPHGGIRRSVIETADISLRECDLLAFHCTNLHPAEIAGVEREGLVPLDVDMVTRRVRARVAAGDILDSVGARLLAKTKAHHENRLGRVCLILTRSTLRDRSRVYRLLSYWGGEAVYAPHEDDPAVGRLLAEMGTPSIVEVTVPVSQLECFRSIGESLLIGYLSRRGVETGHRSEFEGCVRTRISGQRVSRVLGPDDPDFGWFTG